MIHAEDIMSEIAELTPIYAGVSYDRIETGEALHWPVRDSDHPGTPILHIGQFSGGWASSALLNISPQRNLPDENSRFS